MKLKLSIILLTGILLLSYYNVIAQKSGYEIINTFHIASSGGWDYIAVCPINNNIYVSHATQVNILNKTTGDSVGIITNTQGVHGIAFVPEMNKGYTSNGKTNNLTVFNLQTNAIEGEIKTGEKPDAIMYDEFSKKLIVCNGKSNDINIIDPSNNTVIKSILVGGKPETAVTDEKGTIYVNLEDKNEIVVINPKTYTVENRWKTGKGEEPTGLVIDTKSKRLFAGCGNKYLIAMDATNGKIIAELLIGDGCDGVAFDPENKMIYCSTGEGILSIYQEKSANKIVLVENAKSKKGARTLDIDKKTHLVYMPTADFEPLKPDQKRPGMVPGTFQVIVMGKK